MPLILMSHGKAHPEIVEVKNDQFIIHSTGEVTLTAYGHDSCIKEIPLKIIDKDAILGIAALCLGGGGLGAAGALYANKRNSKTEQEGGRFLFCSTLFQEH